MSSDVSSDNSATFEQVRDKDHAVMTCIRRGEDDVHAITQATTLSRREVNYAVNKLEDLGLIEVDRPDGYTERVVDGQPRKFRTPKQTDLTDRGMEYFEQTEQGEDLGRYDAMEYEELVEKVNELEHEVQGLRQAFSRFRDQVQRELRDEKSSDG